MGGPQGGDRSHPHRGRAAAPVRPEHGGGPGAAHPAGEEEMTWGRFQRARGWNERRTLGSPCGRPAGLKPAARQRSSHLQRALLALLAAALFLFTSSAVTAQETGTDPTAETGIEQRLGE